MRNTQVHERAAGETPALPGESLFSPSVSESISQSMVQSVITQQSSIALPIPIAVGSPPLFESELRNGFGDVVCCVEFAVGTG
jgi:hypothetical protein